MDRLSSWMIRGSFAWLLIGVALGGLMLTDRAMPGNWRLWVAPTHGHVLFVGWFVQFVVAVAYWLLPRRRTPARPLGYDERVAVAAAVMLNLGLALRVVAEPVERVGEAAGWTLGVLAVSAASQILAVAVFVGQLWPRVGARPARGRATPPAVTETA